MRIIAFIMHNTDIRQILDHFGLEVLACSSQAHFLMNCGLMDAMQAASIADRVAALQLFLEHELGELFKVIGLAKCAYWETMGIVRGDRTRRL